MEERNRNRKEEMRGNEQERKVTMWVSNGSRFLPWLQLASCTICLTNFFLQSRYALINIPVHFISGDKDSLVGSSDVYKVPHYKPSFYCLMPLYIYITACSLLCVKIWLTTRNSQMLSIFIERGQFIYYSETYKHWHFLFHGFPLRVWLASPSAFSSSTRNINFFSERRLWTCEFHDWRSEGFHWWTFAVLAKWSTKGFSTHPRGNRNSYSRTNSVGLFQIALEFDSI